MRRLRLTNRLRGKMTLTYTAVTGGVFLFLWLLTLVLLLSLEAAPEGTPISESFFSIPANDVLPYMQESPPDYTAIQIYLDLWIVGDELQIQTEGGYVTGLFPDLRYVAVIDADNTIVAIEPQALPFESILPHLPPEVLDAYDDIGLQGNTFVSIVAPYHDDETAYYVMMPLIDDDETLLGRMLFVFGPDVIDNNVFDELFTLAYVGSGLLLLSSIIMGTLFGWIASRGLAQRLDQLNEAVNAWADGDFSVKVRDTATDELGDLGRNLNRMADELDTLLITRAGLASVEERNRLARDLHDTVKQQIFAASMQLASARELVEQDPSSADVILAEMERINDEIQAELTTLIKALRPAALTDKGLVSAMQDYIDDWSQRTGIETNFLIQNERTLPLLIEQELYRVVQEGLSNVAKHAEATQVIIRLSWQKRAVTLEIQDDGIGFENQKQSQGFGLDSMNERLSALSGLVTIESFPGRGTRVTAIVELKDE